MAVVSKRQISISLGIKAATAANTEGVAMDYSTYDVECLSLCYEWFGYTYHLDGDSQQVNADLEEK